MYEQESSQTHGLVKQEASAPRAPSSDTTGKARNMKEPAKRKPNTSRSGSPTQWNEGSAVVPRATTSRTKANAKARATATSMASSSATSPARRLSAGKAPRTKQPGQRTPARKLSVFAAKKPSRRKGPNKRLKPGRCECCGTQTTPMWREGKFGEPQPCFRCLFASVRVCKCYHKLVVLVKPGKRSSLGAHAYVCTCVRACVRVYVCVWQQQQHSYLYSTALPILFCGAATFNIFVDMLSVCMHHMYRGEALQCVRHSLGQIRCV